MHLADEQRDRDEDDERCRRLNAASTTTMTAAAVQQWMWLDVLHPSAGWTEAQVMCVQGELLHIHYKGWKSSQDEWIAFSSPRIAALHRHTPRQARLQPYTASVGNKVDVLDARDVWCQAEIVAVTPIMVKVHYLGSSDYYDEWLNRDSYRITVLHTKTSRETEDNSCSTSMSAADYQHADSTFSQQQQKQQHLRRPQESMAGGETTAEYCASITDEESFRRALLSALNCVVVEMAGDGNCLFRSVSFCLYGTADHHALVRTACVDYIESERLFFRDFISGGDAGFEDYIQRMKRIGEWGDHVEIQAISEIYNRPVLVFAYSTEPMRTYCELNRDITPIRLSYHFRSHYNAVVSYSQPHHLLQSIPGVIEQQALQISRSRAACADRNLSEAIAASTELDLVNAALEASRESFRVEDQAAFDKAVKESLDDLQRRMDELAKQQSLIDANEHEMKRAVDESVQDDLRRQEALAIEASLRDEDASDQLVQMAINQSASELLSGLPRPVRLCHERLQFPLDVCVQAYSRYSEDDLKNLPEELMLQEMTEWIVSNMS